MNKSELIEALAQAQGLTIRKADQVVTIILDSMADALIRGDRVEIRGFGSFKVKDYDGYQGRNPKTGDILTVGKKRLPAFRVGKELRELVDR